MSTARPTKRKRLPRSCTVRAKQQDIALSCELMESIQDCLSKHSHDDADIQALLDSIDIFRRNHYATQYSPSHEQKEPDEADEDQDDGIDLEEEDTWSDELSEHDSDRDFIAPSDEEEEDASYMPSESEAESTEDAEDTEDMDRAYDDEEDKENEVP